MSRLVPRPDSSSPPRDHWIWFHSALCAIEDMIPYGAEPRYLGEWGPDGPAAERGNRIQAEDDCSEATRTAIETFLGDREMKWPRTSAEVAFFAHERVVFAKRFALACLSSSEAGPGVPVGQNKDVIRWMLLELYDGKHFKEGRWAERLRDWWE